MDRRTFLKAFTATSCIAASPTLVASLLKDEEFKQDEYINPDFNPNVKYGNALIVHSDDDELLLEAKRTLDTNMREFVPPKYRNKIRYKYRPPGESGVYDPLEELGSLAWTYAPWY